MAEKITGNHAIEEALKKPMNGMTLYVVRGSKRALSLELAAQASGKVAVKRVTEQDLAKMDPDNHGAVLTTPRGSSDASSRMTVQSLLDSLGKDDGALVLILDEITDPHNLGAIIRSADQFGVNLIVLPERRSVSVNETAARVSSGASRYVPVTYERNLRNVIDTLKLNGFWIYGADMNGSPSYNAAFAKKSAIIMGSEGSGMRDLVRANCDEIISIPMRGHIDSLNVSVAAGILLYEFRRSN